MESSCIIGESSCIIVENSCLIKVESIKRRIETELIRGSLSDELYISYNKETGEFKKNVSTFDLKFKINVIDNYEHTYQIGSFIRTMVSLLIKINPTKILIIIDLSSYKGSSSLNIKRIIDQIIYVSTSSAILPTILIILSNCTLNDKLYRKQVEQGLLESSYINICTYDNVNLRLNNYTPFYVDQKKINTNVFSNFNSTKNYISIDYKNLDFVNVYSPLIYQLASYDLDYLQSNKDRLFIVCIEKVPNVHRINQLISNYKLNNLIICLPDSTENNKKVDYINIKKLCTEYNIKNYDLIDILSIINHQIYKDKDKNIVGIDMHKDAITFNYNKRINELNNCIMIFGFELTGIPKEIISLCKIFVQFEARKSVNVSVAVSLILSSIY
jgi:hypothetical protein